MIKKIMLALLLSCVVVSCGKKGDPEYKDPKNEAKIQVILIQKT
jgi:predicted small lipoprotein YifL|tara:strand:+ start:632 stop:763 length:132 start_codon:yes stop_codon:yes gene_type:complete